MCIAQLRSFIIVTLTSRFRVQNATEKVYRLLPIHKIALAELVNTTLTILLNVITMRDETTDSWGDTQAHMPTPHASFALYDHFVQAYNYETQT